MTLIQFDADSGSRIADAVRYVESQANRRKPLSFAPVETPRKGFAISVAKPHAPVMPGHTAIFSIYTGTPGYEVLSGVTVTAYVRHESIVPTDYVSLAKTDGELEVSSGGYQVRQVYGLTSDWHTNEYRNVSFVGGGTAVAYNDYAELAEDSGARLAFAYNPQANGVAQWSLIAASEKLVTLATFTGSWASSQYKQVNLYPTTSTASVYNRFDDFVSEQPTNTAAIEFCLLVRNGERWELAEKKRSVEPPSVRPATFTGSWSINGTKTVTFKNQTTTPNTVVATNLTLNLPDIGLTPPFDCVIARQGTAWFLASATEHNTKQGTFVGPWSKGATKTVSLSGGGSVQATNRHATISATGTKNCTVARDGMSWELIAAEC